MVKRLIYSLWTNPLDEINVGFNSERNLMECFALSLHFSKKWFDEVHFVTDTKGKELVKKWGLEFDHINTDFDTVLDGVDNKHWSLGKIYACKIQEVPFVHIDIDVILFKPLPTTFLNAEIGFQNYEGVNYSLIYSKLIDHSKKHLGDLPKWYSPRFNAYNTGIILCNKKELIEEWWDCSISYINLLERSECKYDNADAPPCLFFEQVFIYYLCKHYGYQVFTLLDYAKGDEKRLEYISQSLAQELGYTHLLASVKREPSIEAKVRNRLKLEGIFLDKKEQTSNK